MNFTPQIREILSAIAGGRPLLIATDIDGTLTRYSQNRSRIDLVPGILQSFETLAACGVHVAFASARPLSAIEEAFGSIPSATLIANDGCRYKVHGIVQDYRLANDFTAVEDAANAFAQGLTNVEPYNMGHFFGINVEDDNPSYEAAYELLKSFVLPGLTVNKHPMGVTLEPTDKPGKKAAIESLIEKLGLVDPYIIYTGDGGNDIQAQQWVKSLGGLAIKILPKLSAEIFDYVNISILGTDACAAFYAQLAGAVEALRI